MKIISKTAYVATNNFLLHLMQASDNYNEKTDRTYKK